MIFTNESVKPQIAQLLNEYSDLTVVQSDSLTVRLNGQILVYRIYNDFTLRKTYALDIVIPINSDELPYVIDIDRQIKPSYHHYYSNNKLCLDTDSNIRIRFIDGLNLVTWMSEYVEMYYFSYEYYQRFGIFPFGERSHGLEGVIQTYQDLLMAKDLKETFLLLKFIKNKVYRGHHLCPCGNGKLLRNCHGQVMLRFYKDARIKKIVIDDINTIERELAKINESKRN